MKVCLACHAEITGEGWRCGNCAWEPARSADVLLFAPEIFGRTESYDPAYYEELASLEERNYWFVARNRLIHWLALSHAPRTGKYLEVGCGTGFVLQMLQRAFPGWAVYASEAQPEGIDFARNRVKPGATFYQMDACAIPFRDEFDVIGAFDVVEHIRDDATAIGEIHKALKPGGTLVLSVPQHMFLWSKYDESVCHFRRYSERSLRGMLDAAGFTIVESVSFNSLLLPLMMASRYLKRETELDQVDTLSELKVPRFTNALLSSILGMEFNLTRMGARLPVGGSRIVVAKKAA